MKATLDGVLTVRGLTVGHGERVLVADADLDLRQGGSVCVTGASGSGKSTLLMAVCGLVPARDGEISGLGHPGRGASARRLAAWRLARLGIVYQFGELLPELTPLDNVALPALLAGYPRAEAYRRAAGLLETVEVDPRTQTRYLSGGERQRAAVARALVNRPALVVADEPTGSLDPAAAARLTDLLFDRARAFGCALLVVTHAPDVAVRADRRYLVADGKLLAC